MVLLTGLAIVRWYEDQSQLCDLGWFLGTGYSFGYRVLESTRMIQTQVEFFSSLIRAVVRDFDFEL